jgi:membrane protein DedA with SNARE-associated domain
MVGIVPRSWHLQTLEVPRTALLGAAGVRAVLSIIAVPLAPMLYRDHIAVLVLLRPTKEVFLFAGSKVVDGEASVSVIVLAALPILLLGVWVFYALGRAYGEELGEKALPGIAGRILPKKRIDQLKDVLEEKGPRVVFFGRLAAFPSALMAAAAGASGVRWREFVVADTAGALVSMAALLAIGYGLGEAYEEAGPWVTVVGAVVLAGLLVVLGRALTRSGSGGTATRKA